MQCVEENSIYSILLLHLEKTLWYCNCLVLVDSHFALLTQLKAQVGIFVLPPLFLAFKQHTAFRENGHQNVSSLFVICLVIFPSYIKLFLPCMNKILNSALS